MISELISQIKDPKERALFETLLNLSSKAKRLFFLNQIQDHEEYTNAQRIYAVIYQKTKEKEKEALKGGKTFEFSPYHKEIDFYFSKEITEELKEILEQQRHEKQQKIKSHNPPIFHLSKNTPEEIEGGILQPKRQFEQFRDRGQVFGVFATPTPNLAFALQAGKNNPIFTSDIQGDRLILIADKEKFLVANKEHPYSYIYELATASFEPNVGYDGHYHSEWISTKPVAIGKFTKISVKDILQQGARIFFTSSPAEFKDLIPKIIKRGKDKTILPKLIFQKKIIPYSPDENQLKTKHLLKSKEGKC